MPRAGGSDRLRVLRDRFRVYDAAVWDRWLAALLTVLAFIPGLGYMSAQFGDLPRQPADAFTIVLVLGQTLPLAVRSRWPAACLAVVGGCFALHEALAYPPEFGTVTVYFALYTVGAHQERFRYAVAAAATAAYVVFGLAVHLLGSPNPLSNYVIFYLFFAACWLLGGFVRRQRYEETERRRLDAAAATTAERARIARELHDVVTHHVTAMIVHAEATQFVAESPDQVVTAVTTVSQTGRRALAELRYLLDVLEATGESGTPRTPVEETVRQLVDQIRTGGQPVELIEDGARPALPIGVGLALYRVLQEGLTNAVKYAAGQPTQVRIRYREDRVEVEVANDAAPVPLSAGARRELSGGRGLTGLHERVSALGGALTAAARPDGGFRVHASIPLGGAA